MLEELIATASADVDALRATYMQASGPEAQGTYMDLQTAEGLLLGMQARNVCEDAAAVMGWAIKLLAQGRLGEALTQFS